MRQLMYVSESALGEVPAPVDRILEESRHNNALDGVTGLLWSDGFRFLQVLEGGEDAVAETFVRIERDRRHRDIQVLADRSTDRREFGDWSMAWQRADGGATAFDDRMRRALADASDFVRDTFTSLIATPQH